MYLGQGSAMALPIVGNFWNSIATKGGKLARMLAERFPDPPEGALFGCEPWISIAPDSFQMVTTVQDSVLRDSLIRLYTTPPDENDTEAVEGVSVPERKSPDQ
jgi:hypothetical protein